MKNIGKKDTAVRVQNHPKKSNSKEWELSLYVAGKAKKGITAFNNLKLICDGQLKGQYHIKVIDLLLHPQAARTNQILAIPTLVRKSPLPVKNIIGDLSNTESVLASLDLQR